MTTFLAAALTEGLYLMWTRARRPWVLGLVSGAIALGQVVGLGGAIRGEPAQFVLGYAVGSFLAGTWTARWAKLKGGSQP